MSQIYNKKMYYSFEETQAIVHSQIEQDAIEVACIICEKRQSKTIKEYA